MRTLILISNIHQAKYTGQQKVALGLADHLSRAGVEIFLLTNTPETRRTQREKYDNRFECLMLPGVSSNATFLRHLHRIAGYV